MDEVHQGLTPENLQGEPLPSPVLPMKADEDDLWIDVVQSINIQTKDRDRDMRRMQSSGNHSVAEIYRAVNNNTPLISQRLEDGSLELKMLHERLPHLFIDDNDDDDGLLRLQVVHNNFARVCVVCHPSYRQDTIWKTHTLAHYGIQKTLDRPRLNWHWPGMTAEIDSVTKYQGQNTNGSAYRRTNYRGQNTAIKIPQYRIPRVIIPVPKYQWL